MNAKRAKRDPGSRRAVPDNLRTIFGENLRAARLKAGLTQVELAERAKVERTYVTQIEAGSRNITLDIADALAKAVGKNVRSLLRPTSAKKK